MTGSGWELTGIVVISSIAFFAMWHFIAGIIG